MRALCLAALLFSFAGITAAQSNSDSFNAPEVEVVKFSWSKERIGWENDPFRGPVENFDEMRARTRNEKRIADAKRGGAGGADKIQQEAKADAANIATQHRSKPSRYVFLYKAQVKNLGTKTIKTVDWDYVFYDKSTNTELGRQQFTSEEKISPGKSKELLVSITKPPTQTISVTALNKNEGNSLVGRVILMRIEFSDGSIWQSHETGTANQ